MKRREFKSDSEAYWFGIRDGLILVMLSAALGLAGAIFLNYASAP